MLTAKSWRIYASSCEAKSMSDNSKHDKSLFKDERICKWFVVFFSNKDIMVNLITHEKMFFKHQMQLE